MKLNINQFVQFFTSRLWKKFAVLWHAHHAYYFSTLPCILLNVLSAGTSRRCRRLCTVDSGRSSPLRTHVPAIRVWTSHRDWRPGQDGRPHGGTDLWSAVGQRYTLV